MSILLLNKFKLSALALSLVFGLAACDGDDGAAGPAGPQGANGQDGAAGQDGADGSDGANGQDNSATATPGLTRLATVPTGAEVTGAFLSDEGDLFFNVQHPSDTNVEVDDVNSKAFNTGTVGVLRGVNFNNLPANIVNSPVPKTEQERQTVMAAIGEYQILGQTTDTFAELGAKGLAGRCTTVLCQVKKLLKITRLISTALCQLVKVKAICLPTGNHTRAV